MASKPSGLKSETQGDLPTFDVFVSYSHADTRWKDWLVGGLSFPPPIPATIWSDRDILPSEVWNKEIKNALQRARIAVVLISRSYHDSAFIRENELPVLLKQWKKGTTKLLCVPLDPPDMSKLGDWLPEIQWVWPPDTPLQRQPSEILEAALKKIKDSILGELDPEFRRVRDLLDDHAPNYEDVRCISKGTFRSVYQAQDKILKRAVSIVILRSQGEEIRREFENSLLHARLVEDLDVFLTVYQANLQAKPPFYVRQYIDGRTVHEKIQHGRIPVKYASDILLRLGRAIALAHRRGFFHLNIKASNVMVDKRDSVFISALSRRPHYFTWLQTNSGREEGEDRPSDEDYQYAVPELFLGTVPNESLGKCDQYLLGLLGYHMITGRLPDRVSKTRLPKSISAFGDLKPIQQFEGCESCPKVLSDLITKMISKTPSERFASVEEAIERLAKFGDESLRLAKESYRRVAKVKNWKSEIFKEFYDQLFSESEKARNMFQGINMDQQYEMLTEAVLLLLVFCEFDATDLSEPTVLSRVAHKHTKLDLETTDFDQFQSLLVKTFVRHDPDCANNPALEPEVEHAWRKSLQPGIEFMKKHLRR